MSCAEIVMPSRFSRQSERVVRARCLERTALKFVDCLPRARASPRERTPSSSDEAKGHVPNPGQKQMLFCAELRF
eukprot:1378528-Prymnesium_polylepis.1